MEYKIDEYVCDIVEISKENNMSPSDVIDMLLNFGLAKYYEIILDDTTENIGAEVMYI